jgi:hypothetical protein
MTLKGRQIEKRTEEVFDKMIKKKYPSKQGWSFLSGKGFPDRLLYNKKTKELIIYELKANGHEFHPFQKQIIKILLQSKKRSGKVIRYKVDTKTGKTKKLEESNALETDEAKTLSSWEDVENIGII